MGKTKIYFFVLVLCICIKGQVHTDSRGDEVPENFLVRISIVLNASELDSALTRFVQVSGLSLNYNSEILPARKITLNDQNKPAIEVLRRILLGTGIEYIVINHQIVLSAVRRNNLTIRHTVSGYVKDAETGESLLGTNIYIKELTTGCVTNKYGFYSITLPEGLYHGLYSYIGYNTKQVVLELGKDIRLDIELVSKAILKDTVIVIGKSENQIATTAMGTIELSLDKLKSVPILFGEQDLLKTLHLLPGVSSYKEGDAGINVRGGNSIRIYYCLTKLLFLTRFIYSGSFLFLIRKL